MGKDREGKFHPRKGRPSGTAREGVGLQPIDSSALEDRRGIAEKYTNEMEEPAPNIHLRHPNRNVDKREERQRTKDTQRFNNPANKSLNETFAIERTDTIVEELPAMLSREEFADLANFKNDLCISVYMGTNNTASVEGNIQKDFIGFKNQIQQLTALLREKGLDQTRIEGLLKPAYDLLRREQFWSNVSHGLALFVSDNFFKYIRLPLTPANELLINSTFYLTPLIPVMTSGDYFYVLVLSKKQAKLYRADAWGMQYIQVPGMPNGMDDVVHFEEKDDQKLFRTDTAGAGGGANYHGIGSGKPDEKANLAMYFDEVDETIWREVLHNENVPLLLVGVEYLMPIYKQVAKYKPIWDEVITGSHEYEDTTALYAQARAKLEPYFMQRVTKALNGYWNQLATGLTTSIVEDIVPAAHYGRVYQLFVLKGEHIWGSFDEMNNVLTIHPSREEADECLVDRAVIKTLMTGGEVFILPEEKMPGRSKLAAVMRY
ncbi:MAG TPA: hypothetical protein VF490_03680 [Chryseosolibacter sp.]